MKVIVISDNHYHTNEVEAILRNETYDLAIHTGDSQKNEKWLSKWFNYYVAGNNDDFYEPEEIEIDLGGLKTLILHGHTRGIYVFSQTQPIKNILKSQNYDLIIHGHTHIYRNDLIENTKVLCPGSTNYTRGPEGNGYLTFEIHDQQIKNVKFLKI